MANLRGFDELLEVGELTLGTFDQYGDRTGQEFKPEHVFYYKEKKRTYSELINSGNDIGERELLNLYTLRESTPFLSTSKVIRINKSLYNVEEIHDNGGEVLLIRARFRTGEAG